MKSFRSKFAALILVVFFSMFAHVHNVEYVENCSGKEYTGQDCEECKEIYGEYMSHAPNGKMIFCSEYICKDVCKNQNSNSKRMIV